MAKPEIKPTDAELEVLNVLWRHGPSSVREVNEEVSKNREVVYTTTLKMMQVMTEKGFLRRDTSRRTHLYEAAISEDSIQRSVFDKMLQTVFRGSPLKLVVQALGHERTRPEDLEEIKRIIEDLTDSADSGDFSK
jgi:BlaI family penicillinase repressor